VSVSAAFHIERSADQRYSVSDYFETDHDGCETLAKGSKAVNSGRPQQPGFTFGENALESEAHASPAPNGAPVA
jgi:hypothetical protein